MKNIIWLLILLLMPTVFSAGLIVEPTVPQSVLPNSYFPLAVKVTNSDSVAIQNIKLELNAPRYLDADNDKRTVSSLAAGQSVVVQWSIKVSSNAPSGYDVLDVDVDTDTSHLEIQIPFLVKSIESSLEITSVSTKPVSPGNDVSVELNLQNHASFKLKDVRVIFDLNQVPFAPRDGTEERIVQSLNARDNAVISFGLTALPKAEVGIYKIPVKILYFDEFGQAYTKLNTVALEINALPRLEITSEGKIIIGQRGELTLKIVNSGLTLVKFLTISIDHPSIISAHSVYIGDLDVDDFQTSDLEVFAEESFNVPLTIDFRDANNQQYHQQVELNVPVIDRTTAQKLGLQPKSKLPYIVGAGVLLAVIYLIRKRSKKQ